MKVELIHPSSMEAEVEQPGHDGVAAACKPIRWHSGQRILNTYVVVSSNNNGKVLDRAIITVNQKTGKLSLKKLAGGGIPLDVDTRPKPADDIAEGQK